ncbi:MAG: MFS transporter [Chloroflexi bacterium]|nr:MFS transporter [Chloroflexota bacterium]
MATVIVALVALTIAMSGSTLNTALPTLTRTFDVPPSAVAWVTLTPTLIAASTLALFGRLGDLTGKKRLYAVGITITLAGSILCALSPSLGFLIAARAVQGIGTTILNALSVAYLIAVYPATRRGTVVGVWEMAISLGIAAGPVIGGQLLGAFGWQAVFLAVLPPGALALALLPRHLVDPPRPSVSQRFDVIGAALFAIAVGGLMYVLTQGSEAGWTSPLILAGLAGTLLGGAGFVLVERRISHPMVDLSMFRNLTFSAGNGAKIAGYLPFSATQFLVPFYLDGVLRLDPGTLGLVLTAFPVGMLGGSALSGPLSDRVGTRLLAPGGLLVVALGSLVLMLIQPELGVVPALAGTFLVGFGIGTFIAPNDSAIMSATPPDRLGLANGIMGVSRSLGVATGAAMAAGLFTARMAVNGGHILASFREVYGLVVLIALIGAALAALRDGRSTLALGREMV